MVDCGFVEDEDVGEGCEEEVDEAAEESVEGGVLVIGRVVYSEPVLGMG